MEGQGSPSTRRDIPWRLVAIGVLVVYALLLVILNADEVDVSFVFFTAQISLLVLILLCLAIGFVAGLLADNARRRRRER